ncbi:MAG: class I SAM-dependent methyltransferase [Candidatus Thiodiazotropha sp.]
MITKKDVLDTYKHYAPFYDFIFGAILQPGRNKLIELIHQLSPSTILEVGVGTGLTLPHYPKNSKLVGIDLSSEMLSVAKKRKNEIPERDITLHLMNAEDMGFSDGSFDCVVLPYVLSVTPDPLTLVSELRRVCKQDGAIIILNHFSGGKYWCYLERMVGRLSDKIGFHSEFSFNDHILIHDWHVETVQPVNLLGLSKLVHIKNT